MCGGQGIESTGGFHQLEGTTQIPADFGNEFPCCSGHDRQLRRSSLGFEVHPESDGFVARAALMRDQGKQPAQILRELLDVYGEELPAVAVPS